LCRPPPPPPRAPPPPPPPPLPSPPSRQVGSQFKRQLAELASKLSALQPHYVRCIKPNARSEGMLLDKAYALEQLKWVAGGCFLLEGGGGAMDWHRLWPCLRPWLGSAPLAPAARPRPPHIPTPLPTQPLPDSPAARCGGVMEAVRIANAGYPLRRTFGDFLDAFWPLAPTLRGPRLERRASAASAGGAPPPALGAADKAAAAELLRGVAARAGPKLAGELREGADWQVGHSMVFMRAGAAAALTRMQAHVQHAAAARVQAGWRGAVARREAEAARAALVGLQAAARGLLARREAQRRREASAAAVLQAAWRGRVARRDFAQARAAALVLQAGWRGAAGRRRAAALRRTRAAEALQAAWRGAAARAAFAPTLRRHRAALKLQAAWRAWAAARRARYGPEHDAAARRVQFAWRNRVEMRSYLRRLRLQNAVLEASARHRSALTLQSAWRRRVAVARAGALRDAARREAFRRNAAMFQSMAAAAGSSPGKPGAPGAPVAQSVFRIMANGGTSGHAVVPRPLSPGSGNYDAAAAVRAMGSPRRYVDVVKSDATAHLEPGERLAHRGVGELRDRAKVTSLLGIWQQRLAQQQQRSLHQRARAQQARAREAAVWARQQQLLRLHQQRQRLLEAEQQAELARARPGWLELGPRPAPRAAVN
jgi:hypothetical protein